MNASFSCLAKGQNIAMDKLNKLEVEDERRHQDAVTKLQQELKQTYQLKL